MPHRITIGLTSRATWGLAGVIVLGVATWTAVQVLQTRSVFSPAVARESGRGLAVKVTPAALEQLTDVIGASCLAQPTRTIEVKTPQAGRVDAVYADLGQTVRRGAELVRLDVELLAADVGAAEASLDKSTTDVENSQKQHERMARLVAQEVLPKVQLEQAALHLKSAQLEQAKALQELQAARYRLQNATIASPVTGVIMSRTVNPGESVGGGESLFTIGELDSMMVVADVAEEKVSNVHLGQNADVVFDAYRNAVARGRVARIDFQTDPERRTFKVYIAFDEPQAQLRAGLAGFARLADQRMGLTIPRLALIENAGESTVFVVADQKAHLRRIRIGTELLQKVEVVSGLAEGEQVVYYGLLGLRDGDPVNVDAYARWDEHEAEANADP